MNIPRLKHIATLCVGWLVSSLAFAGQGGQPVNGGIGELTHSPTLEAIGVPALGGAGLLALAALLGLFGYRMLKSRQGAGTNWLLAACLTTLLASGVSGIKLISDAHATISVMFENADGETIELTKDDVMFGNNGGGCAPPFNGGQQGVVHLNNGTDTTQYLTDISISGGDCEPRTIEEIVDFQGGNGGIFLGSCTDSPPLEMAPGDSCDIGVCCLGPF